MYRVYHIFTKDGIVFPARASWRSRFLNPSRGLIKQNVISKCVTRPQRNDYGHGIDGVHVYHKHFNKESLEWIKETGGIFDISDYYFGKSEGDYYRGMCRHADVITCPTKEMQRLIKKETGRDAMICQDPYDDIEFKCAEPEYRGTKTVCWFGHEGNLWVLDNLQASFGGELVTNPEVTMALDKSWKLTPWSPGIMREVFKRHDVVIIPYGDSLWQHSKSPNRLIDSLYSGKIVVTNNTPVVDGLRDFVVVNDDIDAGVHWVWDNSDKALEMTRKGQKFVKENYNCLKLSEQWKEAICKASLVIEEKSRQRVIA